MIRLFWVLILILFLTLLDLHAQQFFDEDSPSLKCGSDDGTNGCAERDETNWENDPAPSPTPEFYEADCLTSQSS